MELRPELAMLIQIIDSKLVIFSLAPVLSIILDGEVVKQYEEAAWGQKSKIDPTLL